MEKAVTHGVGDATRPLSDVLPDVLTRDVSKVMLPVAVALLAKLAPDQDKSKVSRAACDLAAKPINKHTIETMQSLRTIFLPFTAIESNRY